MSPQTANSTFTMNSFTAWFYPVAPSHLTLPNPELMQMRGFPIIMLFGKKGALFDPEEVI